MRDLTIDELHAALDVIWLEWRFDGRMSDRNAAKWDRLSRELWRRYPVQNRCVCEVCFVGTD